MKKENAVLVVVILLVIVSVAVVFANTANSYFEDENPDNLCAAPAGYSEQQWREHMGHHPDRYAECLS